jgi:hypothetical protein
MVDSAGADERSLIVVRGHRPAQLPRADVDTSGMVTLAVVLSTHRSSSREMVLDHDLWFACMEAVSTVVGATDSEVWLEPRRGFLSWLPLWRGRAKWTGTVDAYLQRVRTDAKLDPWHTIVWRKAGDIVAAATCERWYQSGGPAPYHDSYTTCIFLSRPASRRLVAVLQVSVARAGGYIEGMIDAPAAAAS